MIIQDWYQIEVWNLAAAKRKLGIAFKWLDDSLIGELPVEWNHLVGIVPENAAARLLHYTLGGPWIKDWKGGPLDDLWLKERAQCG